MLEAYILGALWELISKSFQNCEASAYSLHAIYFLAMYSVEAEARIPLWHPKRICWRQWIDDLLQFQSQKAPWTAPTTPALSAHRGSVPTDGAAVLIFCWLTQSCGRSSDRDSDSTRAVLTWPWQLAALKGRHISLCSCTLGANGHVQTQDRELSTCLSTVKEKGVILTAAKFLSIT